MPWRLRIGGVAASWCDGARSETGVGGCVREATEDSSAAPAWQRGAHSQDHGTAQETERACPPGSLRVNMSRLLQRVIQREGHVSSANQTTQRRTEHLWLTRERVDGERESVLAAKSTMAQAQAAHEEHEGTDCLPQKGT